MQREKGNEVKKRGQRQSIRKGSLKYILNTIILLCMLECVEPTVHASVCSTTVNLSGLEIRSERLFLDA